MVGDGAAAEIAPPKVFRRQWLIGTGPAGGDGDRRRGSLPRVIKLEINFIIKKIFNFFITESKKKWLVAYQYLELTYLFFIYITF